MMRAGVRHLSARRAFRSKLLKGSSIAAVAVVLSSTPAAAQLAGMRAALGVPTNVGTQAPTPTNTVTAVTPTMNQILARHHSYEMRVQQAAGLVAQANAAARAAARAAAQAVPDGLRVGGLDPVALTLTSAQDPTGLSVWEGATKPTQTQNGTTVDVTINQTQSRALLSWNSFNIGANTALTFNQLGNTDWVAVNRVVGNIGPDGLLDPSKDISPTKILGSIKADGSVYILDRAGVMFGANSQVNLHSLLVSSLELGSATIPAPGGTLHIQTLRERNDSFLARGLLPDAVSGLVSAVAGEQHGDVTVDSGAQINGKGGYIILAAPNVSSAGEIKSSVGGQVSLEAGTQVDATISSGAADSPDPYVRGLILSSIGGGSVNLTGSIDAPQGYISLGTDLAGTINMGGVLTSTTSVSRNGKISLIGGTVSIADGAAMAITPDLGGATIPQSADSVAAFKSSQIDIGSHLYNLVNGRIRTGTQTATFDLLPADITLGKDSIIHAPSANVAIGGRVGDATRTVDEIPQLVSAKVDIQDNAVINVSGVADHLLDASRNMLEISPAKRNELRDTPTYRDPTSDGGFTLNGATLFIDPRLSGVRADGVAWIGSPLIEAGSLAAQIGVTAPELMTKGGNVTLATLGFREQPADGVYLPSINIASNAIIDFSGGWVRYSAGTAHYSKLITSDGRVVDISKADPNDDFIAIGSGFVEQLPQLADPIVHANLLFQGTTQQQSYVEGRDAGSLTIKAPTGNFNGELHGDVVAGERQVGAGQAATQAPTLPGDIRKLQAAANQLPSAGLLRVLSIPGASIVVGAAEGEASPDTIFLDSDMINAASLGALSLQTSGKVTIDASAELELAAGGAVNIDAGRTITFNGDLAVPAGSIVARTHGVLLGNIFDSADDLPADGILTTSDAPRMFDIIVSDGATLSARGRWVNDSLVEDGLFDGPGYTSGGSITLHSAPHVAAYTADGSGAVDLSGSILLEAGSLLDVSGGGYVSPNGAFALNGRGGNVSLINETSYFQTQLVPSTALGQPVGAQLFRSDLTTFQVTPDPTHVPGVVPDQINATVTIDGDIRAFGFEGGGVFSLVTPDLKFGSSDGTGTEIGLDFLDLTGFGTLSLSAWNTAFFDNVFDNGIVGKTAILATELVQIRDGETLNLTQSILPSILTTEQLNILATQVSGTDISRIAELAPTNALGDWDNLPANLILGGMTELQVLGGTIVGAPTASITAPKIYNAGTIRIAGGSIVQKLALPQSYVQSLAARAAIGVRQELDVDGIDRGAGLAVVFGEADALGKYDEFAENAAGLTDSAGNVIVNRDLVGLLGVDRQIYYLGMLNSDEGIVLAENSITDLAGTSIRNPRASLIPGSQERVATGRVIDGGSIKAAGLSYSPSLLFSAPVFGNAPYTFFSSTGNFVPFGATPALTITAESGATVDLSGAADTFDVLTGANTYTSTQVWSDAGTLSALGGGDVTEAIIDAHGGAPNARGGTIEWLDPVLVQASSDQHGVVSADQIEASGFDTFIARGDVTTLGDVDLTLPGSFLLRARDYSGAALTTLGSSSGDTRPYADPYYAISMGATGALSITAAHIGLLGIDQVFNTLAAESDAVGALELHGGSIDIFGAVAFRKSLSDVLLDSASDIRLIGVQPLAMTLTPDIATDTPSLSGQVVAGGNLTFRAGQVYATTGSGNLQRLIETNGAEVVRPYLIGSAGLDSTIRFESNGSPPPPTPYSAGSYLSVIAPHIEQAGVLRAPLGRIDLGSTTPFTQNAVGGLATTFGPTQSVTLESGSLTSVSLGSLKIPYGTTTDLTEYFFAPGFNSPLTAPPAAELRFGGDSIAILDGATVDASGGDGDIYAYEFVSGTGGSRDVLSRFNSDAFSSTNGFQYADGRQVYAIVPAGTDVSALYDPIYSADYGALYSGDIGKTVHLEGGNGIPAGDYLLLPAQYAMLPGAMRLVENVGSMAPLAGESASMRDGSIILGGTYGSAGTNTSDWERRSFTVQTQDVFRKYSRIELTSGTKDFTQLADRAGSVVPRLPGDAARIVFNPLSMLQIAGLFKTDPEEGGRGSQVDIAAEVIDVVSSIVEPRDGAVSLVASDLGKLNAASLFLGGIRTDLADGSTDLEITAHEINILNDVDHSLSAPEILLAVDGVGSILNIADGASIVATGTLTDTRSGDYNVASFTTSGDQIISKNSGAGAVFRLANGPERMVNRSGALAESATTKPVTYTIGQANLVGEAMAIDTSRQLDFDAGATLDVNKIALSGDNISFSSRTFGIAGLVITPELEQAFRVADSLTIRANALIGFTAGEHLFNDLTLYAPGVRLIRTEADNQDPLAVVLNADNVTFGNKSADAGACRGTGGFTCGSQGNSFTVNSDTLTFGSGVFRTFGFDSAVTLNAASGAYYNGTGAFDVGGADLTLTTPFLVDRGTGAQPRVDDTQADLELRTTGSVVIAGAGAATPIGVGTPGSRLAIGSLSAPAQSISIDSALLRATAGTIELYSDSDISILGSAELATPSYSQTFGDPADRVTVSANGGAISLVALNGDITLGDAATLSIGGATGSAGDLNLFASNGEINLFGTIDAAAPGKGASLNFDAGLSAFDLPAFLLGWGSGFTGDIAIRTGVGDLELDLGQTLVAESLILTADGGSTIIAGTIDTSGVSGGDIGLFARDQVSLLSTAVLDAHADGHAETDTRRASGGDVTLGVGTSGAIDVASGATIDVGATRPGDRLVAQTRVDPRTLNEVTAYTYVQGDQGGTLTLRAPVITQAGSDTVDVDFAGSLTGARDVSIEGYKAYDLAEIAADPAFSGVTVDPITGIATLDLGAMVDGKANFLADLASGTVVDFVQNFDISAARSKLGSLPGLDVYHERPGIELGHAGDITLASNWNLGAGEIDEAGAVAAGLMRVSLLGPDAGGNPRYEIVPGREAELFQSEFVKMTYRVGGTVDGEAGVLTLRAGGNLNINRSISDGFFTFGDQTDPAYISSQLGGGRRSFNPAMSVQCGVGGANPTTCTDVIPYVFGETPLARSSINFNLTAIVRGSEQGGGVAPYSAAANSPAALGLFQGGAGDPIGSAQIFPLLADGTPVDSFSIQLVGGAGASASANPLHIDRASGGNVVVAGETTYALKAEKPVGQYAGSLQLRYETAGANRFVTGDFFDSLVNFTELDAETLSNSTARVQFGQVSTLATEFMRDAAEQFFADYPGQVLFLGPDANPTGFTAPVALVLQFLESRDASGVTLADRFATMINDGSFGYNPPAPFGTIDPPGQLARVRTLVRTGTGSIDVAAARDIDLRNGDTPQLLGPNGQGAVGSASNAAQAGGSAIYTVGHLVAPAAVAARIAGTQTLVTIDPSNYVLPADVRDPFWVPTSAGRLQVNPVYATGGGSISLTAGQDILARRDAWSEAFNANSAPAFNIGGIDRSPAGEELVGSADQRWRVGSIGVDRAGNSEFATNIRINPQLFSSGVGALGGGDVAIDAGRDIRELTVALDTSVTTGDVGDSFGSMVFGGGDLTVSAGHDILGGRFDIASGTAMIEAGRNIGSSGKLILRPLAGAPANSLRVDNLPEIRMTDATVEVTAGGSVRIGKVSALGVDSTDGDGVAHVIDQNALGYYTGRSGLSIQASGDVSLAGEETAFYVADQLATGVLKGAILPASLEVTSFNGDIGLGDVPLMLYPGAKGQLSLLAGGTLAPVTIDLDDGDASLLPGIFSVLNFNTAEKLLFSGRPFGLPVIQPRTTDVFKRLYHASAPLHADDDQPVRIAVGGDLVNTTLFLAKQARISAGGDIVNMMFFGQNVEQDDVTRIVAGRDIKATVAGATFNPSVLGRSIFQGNQFIIGGPGAIYVEAGRDLGPFLGSATLVDDRSGVPVRANVPGGILSVGNDFNPALPAKSADIYAFFGVGNGMDFAALRETYVNPANIDALDGDLFEQVSDEFGNKSPDRTKPIYAPILIAWMKDNQADALIAAFDTVDVTAEQAYTVFAALPDLVQRKFLLDKVYFSELAAPSRPDGPSYLQYVRGYRAVNTLFPASLGYTANDLSGAANGGTRVSTGNLDLRLATIQTSRGSDVTILGPGGDAILGSVVRTSAQAARRAYQPSILEGFDNNSSFALGAGPRPVPNRSYTVPVLDIPIGYEGVLTLRGGAIRGFTDGDIRLNQSRLFSQQSGDITLWSSNGDLNAGQGPKSAANSPPIVIRIDPNGFAEVDSAGAVSGAGIAGFTGIRRRNPFTGEYELVDPLNDSDVVQAQLLLLDLPSGSEVQVAGKTYRKDAPTITLVAPVGTVDAGDAGVRAGGDIFVAAAQVANADNFKVGGASIGIPSAGGATAPPTPAGAASALASNLSRATNPNGIGEQRVRILVDVLGFYGSGTDDQTCPPDSTDPKCKAN